MKFYIASSWRNGYYPAVVGLVRSWGHEVYDFRNPEPNTAFTWEQIDPKYQSWNIDEYVKGLNHPLAESGFHSDFKAMLQCDAMILVLPSGRSAHLEAGWCVGAGKPLAIYSPEPCEPELMAKMSEIITCNLHDLHDWVERKNNKILTDLAQRWGKSCE